VSVSRWALPVVTGLAALAALAPAVFLLRNGIFGFTLSEDTPRKLKWSAALVIGLVLLAYASASIVLTIQMLRSQAWSHLFLYILQGTVVACVIALLFFGEVAMTTLGFLLIALLILTFTQFLLARSHV
jgi:hypothetical protein